MQVNKISTSLTILFYLYPGIHTLNRNLDAKNAHNLNILVLSGREQVILVLGSLVHRKSLL